MTHFGPDHLCYRVLPWMAAALLALMAHAGAGVVVMSWRPPPVTPTLGLVSAQLITRTVTPSPPATPPVKVEQKRSVEKPARRVLAARPRPAPAPRPAPVSEPAPPPVAPVVASAPLAPARAAEPVRTAPAPAPRELAVHCPQRQPPAYPAAARRRGLEGSVELRVALAASGALDSVAVVVSSGSPLLDAAAVAAVRRWRCDPARVGGIAVAAVALQSIHFSLH